MDARPIPPQAYQRPTVADFGTLAELTADSGMLMPFGVAPVSGPLVPQPPGGPGPEPHASQVPNAPGGGGSAGDVASGGAGGGGGGGGDSAGERTSGGGGGGGGGFANPVETGSGGGGLPFTGFPAAIAAAVGAALAGGGAALRRKLGRKRG
jgi:hypothetical protein